MNLIKIYFLFKVFNQRNKIIQKSPCLPEIQKTRDGRVDNGKMAPVGYCDARVGRLLPVVDYRVVLA